LVNRSLAAERDSLWNAITNYWSHIGNTEYVIGVCVIVALIVWWRTKQWWYAVVPVIAISLQATIFVIATAIVGRPRPPVPAGPGTAHVEFPQRSPGCVDGPLCQLPAHGDADRARLVALARHDRVRSGPPARRVLADVSRHAPCQRCRCGRRAGDLLGAAGVALDQAWSGKEWLVSTVSRPGPIVVVVNPTKFDGLGEVRQELSRLGTEHEVEIRVVETTEDDPGFGQTRTALDQGAAVVCALGGDGTVRAVAQELAGTGVALGLLPGGTGNLLARNLDVPVSSISEAMEVVLDGLDRVIDLGWLDLDGERHAFTVMAGLGFDAKIMDDAPEGVKARVGWAAYVMSASKHLGDNSFQASITIDAGSRRVATRTVIVGNCGTLTGGIVLPDAVIDDGVLDVAILTPQSLADWTALAGRVLVGKEVDGPSIERRQGRQVELTAQPAQLVSRRGRAREGHPGHDQHRSRHSDRPRSTVRNGAPPPRMRARRPGVGA
jgi:diacylglycerol kinase family enzyme